MDFKLCTSGSQQYSVIPGKTPKQQQKRHVNEIKKRYHINSPIVILLICGVVLSGFAWLSDARGSDSFQEKFKDYQGHIRAGTAAINNKDYARAVEQYTEAIELSPFEPSHYYNRGLAWYRKGKTANAIEDFNKVIILDSRWHSAYAYRGLCRVKRQEYGKALNDYKSALNLKQDDAAVHNNLAWFYATAKDKTFRDNAKALEHAKKATAISKERNAEILDTLARAYFINGKIKEAVEVEKKALKLNSGSDEFRENLKRYEKGVKE